MKIRGRFGLGWMAIALALACVPTALAQNPVPVVAPVVVDTTVPIITSIVKPKTNSAGLAKFEGFVMNAKIAQIKVRAKYNELILLN